MFIQSIDDKSFKQDLKHDTDDEKVKDKNIGIIKCVDITKLMKPTLVEKSKISNDSVILLSSDSETDVKTIKKEIVPNKKRKKTHPTNGVIENNTEYTDKRLRSSAQNVARVQSFASLRDNRQNRLRNRQSKDNTSSSINVKENNIRKCYVSLPKIPVEKLKDFYLNNKADSVIER